MRRKTLFVIVGAVGFVALSCVMFFVLRTEDTTNTREVTLYFGNEKFDPLTLDCSQVFPVKREVASGNGVEERSLMLLLDGPTQEEVMIGYTTSINQDSTLYSIVIKNGVATADFGDALSRGVAGSCRVLQIRAQIEETLRQFEGVESVIISVNGKTEAVLEP